MHGVLINHRSPVKSPGPPTVPDTLPSFSIISLVASSESGSVFSPYHRRTAGGPPSVFLRGFLASRRERLSRHLWCGKTIPFERHTFDSQATTNGIGFHPNQWLIAHRVCHLAASSGKQQSLNGQRNIHHTVLNTGVALKVSLTQYQTPMLLQTTP